MAVFLAAYCLNGSAEFSSDRLADILQVAGHPVVYETPACKLAYVDLQLWPGASSLSSDSGMAVIAGDPQVLIDDAALPRQQAIEWLMDQVIQGDLPALRRAHGVFSGLVADRASGELLAMTDKLGVRPIYWARTDSKVFVASALWPLLALDEINMSPDWRAASESAAFGFPMGDRSPFQGIQLLPPGTVLRLQRGSSTIQQYHNWSQVAPHGLTGDALRDAVSLAFDQACARRAQNQGEVLAFLSGGMDSRLVTSALRRQGCAVHTLNFAPAGSQDLIFGRLAAQALGTEHFEYSDGDADFAQRQAQALDAWRAAHPEALARLSQPRLIWSGDGGSVGLGHVYLNPDIIATARSEGLDAAAAAIQDANRNRVSPHIFASQMRSLADWPLRSISEDLKSRPHVEPGRNCHLFFMLNDQRRHLSRHFEEVHLHRIDLVLPFFDGRFLELIIGADVDAFIDHRLYHELLMKLPDRSATVPWQTYPGHVACPVPTTEALRSQWSDGWFDQKSALRQRRSTLRARLGALRSADGLAQVLNRNLLLVLNLIALSGVRRFDHLLEATRPFLNALRPARPVERL